MKLNIVPGPYVFQRSQRKEGAGPFAHHSVAGEAARIGRRPFVWTPMGGAPSPRSLMDQARDMILPHPKPNPWEF